MSVIAIATDVYRSHFAILLVLVKQSITHTRVARPRWEAGDEQADWLLVAVTVTAARCGGGGWVTGDSRVTGSTTMRGTAG